MNCILPWRPNPILNDVQETVDWFWYLRFLAFFGGVSSYSKLGPATLASNLSKRDVLL